MLEWPGMLDPLLSLPSPPNFYSLLLFPFLPAFPAFLSLPSLDSLQLMALQVEKHCLKLKLSDYFS